MSKQNNQKKAYTVACSSRFREQIEELVQSRNISNDNINIGDMARAVMLLIPNDVIQSQPDPGEPDQNDRDIVTVRHGRAAGRTMPRKPRLQVRMPGHTNSSTIRKALGLALSIEKGWASLMLDDQRADSLANKLERTENEIKRLQSLIQLLAFKPLPQGVKTRRDALHVLGFHPDANPSVNEIKSSYRALALIYHPDSNLDKNYGLFHDNLRMSQLNDAMRLLTRK